GGRMELRDDANGPLAQGASNAVVVVDGGGRLSSHEVPRASGDLGGGDAQLHDRLFGEQALPDPLGHMAGSWAGAMSILIGVAANRSIATGEAVAIADLL